jgi:hypothetical protein
MGVVDRTMLEEKVEVLDSELLKEADETSRLPSLAPAGDELRTARLSAVANPPASVGRVAVSAPILPPPAPLPSFSDVPSPSVKPSGFRALLTSTFAPANGNASPRAGELARRAVLGAMCLALALLFALVALVSGIRASSPDPNVASTIIVAETVARTVFALGAGALSYALFRMTERLIT